MTITDSQLGTITGTVNAAGVLTAQRYTPHGVNLSANTNLLPFDFTFTGQTDDPGTGLIDYNARHYDPQLGRFTQADTVLDGLNRYTYVHNNPLKNTDPSGHCVESLYVNSAGEIGWIPMRGAECWAGDTTNNGEYAYVNQPGTTERDRINPFGCKGHGCPGEVGDWQFFDLGFRYLVFDYQACVGDDAGIGGCSLEGAAALACKGPLKRICSSIPGPKVADDVVDAASDVCRANSFVAGTRVLMADGSRMPIEDIEIGDWVWAHDPETGETGPRQVVDTIVGEGRKDLVEIGVVGDTVTATDGHPFWVDDEGRWVDAGALEVGDRLLLANGSTVGVTAVEGRVDVQRVHNLTVEGVHTYYVEAGDTGVLVHNCTPAESPVWQGLTNWRGKTRTNGLSGRRRQYYEWDYIHGEIEVYNSRGVHIGVMDPLTSHIIKPAVPGRTIDVS